MTVLLSVVVLPAAVFLIGKYGLKSGDSGENEISGIDQADSAVTDSPSKKAEEQAVPTAYENIISQYRNALEKKWNGQ